MVIRHYSGDLLTSTANLLLHQVNCQGAMNSGVAKAIREKYPVVFEKYSAYCESHKEGKTSDLLGGVLPVKVNDTQRVMNLFAEDRYGYDGQKYTSYDALDTCLKKVAEYCVKNSIPSIALPYKMSSDRGGADWDVVLALIMSAFVKTNVIVEIWELKKNED